MKLTRLLLALGLLVAPLLSQTQTTDAYVYVIKDSAPPFTSQTPAPKFLTFAFAIFRVQTTDTRAELTLQYSDASTEVQAVDLTQSGEWVRCTPTARCFTLARSGEWRSVMFQVDQTKTLAGTELRLYRTVPSKVLQVQ